MRKLKKLASLLLALVMCFGLTSTAFAANDGSITISNATEGETYTIYKMLDMTYDSNTGAYA
ncbi:MAG: hypothetical protein LUE61_04645 [Clostridiales bacterium]|nr:hypothetical protein [Clostridiales bacterium]